MSTNSKRARGRFYTLGNPFALGPFRHWAKSAGLPGGRILEPFAGANNIVKTLQETGLCDDFVSYDIAPAATGVKKRDTISSFPKGFGICITNPPWLARNSATRRGLSFPNTVHDDLYKHCLEICLAHCEHVAALVPASFLQSGLFRDRLAAYILLHGAMFSDTDNPVCLALFTAKAGGRVEIYHDDQYIGALNALSARLPQPRRDRAVRFNDPRGKLGFVAFDNTREPSIRFCPAEEIGDYRVKVSSRFITRISGDFGDIARMAGRLNRSIKTFRDDTWDIFLTPFKGMRIDGRYRRRMEFALARRFINAA